jgi:hypothetical protein
MAVTKDNRTLSILNAAAAGEYGILSAIAYGTHPEKHHSHTILKQDPATILNI